jgi:glucose-6-phosphate 1-epimerase
MENAIAQLNERFGLDGVAKFESGIGGLPRLAINSPLASAHIYLHGAHLTHWQPRSQQPVIWLSQRSHFQPGKAIRGGVPICFPWFGPRDNDPTAPLHGLVRTEDWQCHEVRSLDDGRVQATFGYEVPDEFDVSYTITVGASLTLQLTAAHSGTRGATYEMALHTYLAVGDVRQVSVRGLDGVMYVDKTDGFRHKRQSGDVTITGETDRVYLDAPSSVTLHDAAMSRRIVTETTGARSAVVWNPWIEKAAKMADFGDDEWPQMICLETANVMDNAVTLAPGASHTMAATIRVD